MIYCVDVQLSSCMGSHVVPKLMHVVPRPMHVAPRPVHVAPRPVHVVPRPMYVVTKPMHVVPRPMHVVTKLMHVVPRPMHSTSAMQAIIMTKILLVFDGLQHMSANKAAHVYKMKGCSFHLAVDVSSVIQHLKLYQLLEN